MALKIRVHEATDDNGELIIPVIAIKFNDPEEASEQDYYLRDGWGHVVNTTIDGDTLYIEDTGMKVEKILRDWFPDKDLDHINVKGKIAKDLRGEFESKKSEDAEWVPPAPVKIKTLKKEDLFTLKPIENPKESQVWSFQGYDPSDRTYWAIRWDNISISREFNGDKDVYTEFNF